MTVREANFAGDRLEILFGRETSPRWKGADRWRRPPRIGVPRHRERERRRDGGHVCTVGFCPICLAVTTVQPLRPEAVEHLLNAAREFLLAMSAVLSARADDTGGKESGPTLTRIDIE